MKLTVNGHIKEVPATITIAELVGQVSKNPKHIISEVNGNIVASNSLYGVLSETSTC